jgi:tRNA threonylcarbamoyladenosine biosynthesis protein TsaE
VKVEVRCPEAADTRALGRRLASMLHAGDVVLLAGPLGSGKTVFASGIAEGLGVAERVVSPSFVLVRRYEGLIDLVHADLYRIGSLAELEDLDLLCEADEGVLVVEWGNAAEQAFPDDHLLVNISVEDGDDRVVRLLARGSWSVRPIEELVS